MWSYNYVMSEDGDSRKRVKGIQAGDMPAIERMELELVPRKRTVEQTPGQLISKLFISRILESRRWRKLS